MSKTIQGVPESISRAEYIAMFEGIGIDPRYSQSLTFQPDHIEAVIFERDANGARILDGQGEGYIKHRISIPVRDDEEAQA